MAWSGGVAAGSDVTVPNRDGGGRHVHVGALELFDAPDEAFRFDRFLDLVRSRIHLVPRYRQLLVDTPLGLAGPVWQDDDDFDLAYHVRHAALPSPGTTEQLEEYAARVFSRELDRRKPLWELYVIEGLAQGGFALLTKNHRALVDGLSAVAMTSVILDLSPEESRTIGEPMPWAPVPAESRGQLALAELREAVTSPAHVLGGLRRLVDAPLGTVRRVGEIGQGVVSVATANLRARGRAPALDREPGLSRRFVTAELALDEVKAVKNGFATTVNDVVLALVGDALGRLLRGRGDSTHGMAVRAMVPVSVESADERHALGNQVVAVFVDIPIQEMDPVHRLQRVASRMADVKRSHHAVGARFLVEMGSFAIPTIHAMAARLVADPSLYDVVVTNVPGPDVPIWCLGARMRSAYPFVPLAGTHALAVGVTSLDGRLDVAFTTDYDAVPEAHDLRRHVRAALRELAASAEAEHARVRRVQDPTGRRGLSVVDGEGPAS